jgi:hypothetical protein
MCTWDGSKRGTVGPTSNCMLDRKIVQKFLQLCEFMCINTRIFEVFHMQLLHNISICIDPRHECNDISAPEFMTIYFDALFALKPEKLTFLVPRYMVCIFYAIMHFTVHQVTKILFSSYAP